MLLRIADISVTVDGLSVLEGLSLHVEPGELVVVVGANGAGKSTLMRTVAGLSNPDKGTIEFKGEQIGGLPPFNVVAKGVCLIPEGRQLFPDMSVMENLQLGAYHYRKDSARIKKNLSRVFGLFPVLEEHSGRKASSFSGGQQQMLSIGRGLMSEPALLMIDELSLGLAQNLIQMLFKIVKQLNEMGMSILMVEQNVQQALRIADRAYVLDNGRIVLDGTGTELMDNEHVRKAYMGL